MFSKNKHKLLFVLAVITVLGTVAYAGTGGGELNTWYTDISNALKGFWGKVIAAFFLGMAILTFTKGSILGGMFFVFIGLSVGTIPDIVNSRYTLTASVEPAIEQSISHIKALVG